MTQEFVTLPREVVEQALDSLLNEGGFRKLLKPFIEKSIESIREALEQPKECYDQRDPLADQQIDAIAESMPGGLDGFLKGWGWRQFARAVFEAAPQPPTTEQSSAVVEECLTDELKPRFSAHDDAERLKSVARGMSYNDHGEAVSKHTLMEIAVRLESGGYAAPQPPALEQQVEKESTCKDSLQVEQAAVAWLATYTGKVGEPLVYVTSSYELAVENDRNQSPKPLHLHQQNLQCKSTQARLATLWGYVKEQPKLEPLTDEQILHYGPGEEGAVWSYEDQLYFARAIEAAHNIK